jgi:collagenase-like PrtC family protease
MRKKQQQQQESYFPIRPPEIMSPVGGFPQLHAAIANGADSIYLGLSSFSARARASNFNPDTELKQAVSIAHKYGVKVYVALNTLVFQNELNEIASLILKCQLASVDALIVQDIGVTKLIQHLAPELEIHASTQQTVTNADGVLHAYERGGASRVVLGRELSVKEIRNVMDDIRNDQNYHRYSNRESSSGGATTKSEGVEIEAFVHGALCVSYSGQCFSSEAWGGRSANRGQCAQACRLPYGLIQNGELIDLKDMNYLLSPQDLCGIDHVEELIRAGVSCLKIEGRLKDEKYVAATTRAYRNAVDAAWGKIVEERRQLGLVPDDLVVDEKRGLKKLDSFESVSKEELIQLFSRGQDENFDGLTPGFFEGPQHQRLVRGRSPRHRGIHIGRVLEGSSSKNGLLIATDDKYNGVDVSYILKLGDGIVVDRGMPEKEELGGPIFKIEQFRLNNKLVIHFGRDVEKKWNEIDRSEKKKSSNYIPFAPPGAHVWKTSDASIDKKMKKLINSPTPRKQCRITVSGVVGEPLVISIEDLSTGQTFSSETEGTLVEAESNGLSDTSIRKAIGTLGDTDWSIEEGKEGFIFQLKPGLWCPLSWVKQARKDAVSKLISRDDVSFDNVEEEKYLNIESRVSEIEQFIQQETEDSANGVSDKTRVSVLVRDYAQVEQLCQISEDEGNTVDEIIIDFLELDGVSRAVSRIRQAGIPVVIATPRVIKPGEEGIWRSLLRFEPDGLLIRSAGLIHHLMQLGGTGSMIDVGSGTMVKIPALIGDFSLNAVNSLTVKEYVDNDALSRITIGYDLSAQSIVELAKASGKNAGKLEVVAHTHLPIFHTEHCVFARFLTNGNSYLDCGHACTRNTVHLRDHNGNDNLVLADMGCRNTVFSAQAQSGIYSLKDWADAGIGWMRIELVDEHNDDAIKIIDGYKGVLSGRESPRDIWDSLKSIRDSNGRMGGVSLGSLRNTAERRAGEI